MKLFTKILPFNNRTVEGTAKTIDKSEAMIINEVTDKFTLFPSPHVSEEINRILDGVFKNQNPPGNSISKVNANFEIPCDVQNLIIARLTITGISYELSFDDLEDFHKTIMMALTRIVNQKSQFDGLNEKLSIIFSVEGDKLIIILKASSQVLETKILESGNSNKSNHIEPIEIGWNIVPFSAFNQV